MKQYVKRIQRITYIIAELKARRYPNAHSLAVYFRKYDIDHNIDCSVSEKTIKRDMKFIKDDLGAPLKYHAAFRGYYLEDDWELPYLHRTARDIFVLLMMAQLAGGVIPELYREDLKRIGENIYSFLDEGEHSLDLFEAVGVVHPLKSEVKPEIFQILIAAWERRRRLLVKFDDHRNPEVCAGCDSRLREITIEVHAFFIYEGIWYAKIINHTTAEVRNLPLHLIQEATPLDQYFIRSRDLLDGLKSQYNIFGYEEVENIIIKCDKRTAGWLAGKSWFPGQRMERQPNGEYYFYFDRAAKPELIWFIMQNGGHLELLEPHALRSEISSRAELLHRQHQNND